MKSGQRGGAPLPVESGTERLGVVGPDMRHALVTVGERVLDFVLNDRLDNFLGETNFFSLIQYLNQKEGDGGVVSNYKRQDARARNKRLCFTYTPSASQ